jgi:hypothetical protein
MQFCYIENEFFKPHVHYVVGDYIVSVMIDVCDRELHLRVLPSKDHPELRYIAVNPNYLESVVLFERVKNYIISEEERTGYCPPVLEKVENLALDLCDAHRDNIDQV